MSELTTAGPVAAGGRRRATAGLVVLAWCAAVAVAATAGWLVVDRVGSSLLGPSGPGLIGAPAGATATATSTGAAGQPSTLSTAGGRVTASCTAAGAITGRAIPASTSWRVEVNERGPQQLQVEFRSGARKVEVSGRCVAGVAVLTQGHDAGGASGPTPSGTTTDDHGGGSGGGSGGGGSGSGSGKGSGGGGSGGSSGGGSGGSSGGGDDSGGGSDH
jgi:hypothetical protein